MEKSLFTGFIFPNNALPNPSPSQTYKFPSSLSETSFQNMEEPTKKRAFIERAFWFFRGERNLPKPFSFPYLIRPEERVIPDAPSGRSLILSNQFFIKGGANHSHQFYYYKSKKSSHSGNQRRQRADSAH